MKTILSTLTAPCLSVLLATSAPVFAQVANQGSFDFNPSGLEQTAIPGSSCSGFFMTPSFKCDRINIPAYVARAKDGSRRALVILNGNSGGLDRRHNEYAHFLAENNINAVVLDSFKARGHSGGTGGDLTAGRAKGLDGFNMSIDALTAASELATRPEWGGTKFGYMGESMSGSSAINVTRPYIGQIVQQQSGKLRNFDAVVASYPACIDRNAAEGFKKIPFLLIQPEKDDITLASDCKKQVEWMNARGGDARMVILDGEYHDHDGPWNLQHLKAENTSRCASTRKGDKFVLEGSGKEFPATPDGYREMRDSCKSYGHMSGNRGTPRVGYDKWLVFFNEKLLNTP